MIRSIIKKMQRNVNKKVEGPLMSNFFLKKYQSRFLEFKTVFDIGAYHGGFIDEILQLNDNIHVHGFEPYSESYEFLKKKYHQNRHIKINHCAVSDYTGRSNFNINALKETNSLLESISVSKEIDLLTQKEFGENVQVISLTDYCYDNKVKMIDLVKIDAQGLSYNILKGMTGLLHNRSIRYLYVEAEFIEIYKNEKLFSEIEILMRTFGYHIVDFYNFNYLDNSQLAWCDVLFEKN